MNSDVIVNLHICSLVFVSLMMTRYESKLSVFSWILMNGGSRHVQCKVSLFRISTCLTMNVCRLRWHRLLVLPTVSGVSNARWHDTAICPNVERRSVTSRKALTLSNTAVKRRPVVTMCTTRCNFKELCV